MPYPVLGFLGFLFPALLSVSKTHIRMHIPRDAYVGFGFSVLCGAVEILFLYIFSNLRLGTFV